MSQSSEFKISLTRTKSHNGMEAHDSDEWERSDGEDDEEKEKEGEAAGEEEVSTGMRDGDLDDIDNDDLDNENEPDCFDAMLGEGEGMQKFKVSMKKLTPPNKKKRDSSSSSSSGSSGSDSDSSSDSEVDKESLASKFGAKPTSTGGGGATTKIKMVVPKTQLFLPTAIVQAVQQEKSKLKRAREQNKGKRSGKISDEDFAPEEDVGDDEDMQGSKQKKKKGKKMRLSDFIAKPGRSGSSSDEGNMSEKESFGKKAPRKKAQTSLNLPPLGQDNACALQVAGLGGRSQGPDMVGRINAKAKRAVRARRSTMASKVSPQVLLSRYAAIGARAGFVEGELRVVGAEKGVLTTDYFLTHFKAPFVLKDGDMKQLGGQVDSLLATLSSEELLRMMGSPGHTPVIITNVATQEDCGGWTLAHWTDYWRTLSSFPSSSSSSSLSLDAAEPTPPAVYTMRLNFHNTKLSALIKPPAVLHNLSWLEQAWPKPLRLDPGDPRVRARYPQVQNSSLWAAPGTFLDFTLHSGASNAYYHVIQGQVTLLLLEPSAENVQAFQGWRQSESPGRGEFLGDFVAKSKGQFTLGVLHKQVLVQGESICIPAGWIMALFSPVQSILLCGLWLSFLNAQTQLFLAATLEAPLFPFYHAQCWLAAACAVRTLRVLVLKNKIKAEGSIIAGGGVVTDASLQQFLLQKTTINTAAAEEEGDDKADSNSNGSAEWGIHHVGALLACVRSWLHNFPTRMAQSAMQDLEDEFDNFDEGSDNNNDDEWVKLQKEREKQQSVVLPPPPIVNPAALVDELANLIDVHTFNASSSAAAVASSPAQQQLFAKVHQAGTLMAAKGDCYLPTDEATAFLSSVSMIVPLALQQASSMSAAVLPSFSLSSSSATSPYAASSHSLFSVEAKQEKASSSSSSSKSSKSSSSSSSSSIKALVAPKAVSKKVDTKVKKPAVVQVKAKSGTAKSRIFALLKKKR